jgi:hypothetical protein
MFENETWSEGGAAGREVCRKYERRAGTRHVFLVKRLRSFQNYADFTALAWRDRRRTALPQAKPAKSK